MIDVGATVRKGSVAMLAVALAAMLLRPQLSSALVSRGDDLAYAGNAVRARAMYRRARAFDRSNGIAEDRLIFAELMTHDRSRIRIAVADASVYLSRVPSDVTIRMDRALGYQMLKAYDAASRDFARVGEATRDARSLTFAGIDALHAGKEERARVWLLEALRLAPRDEPARRALRSVTS